MKYKTLLIDGPYLSHRSYSAPYKLTTSTNLDSTLIHGFLKTLLSLKKQFNPAQTIIAWESYGTPSWRRTQQPLYKPSRPKEQSFIDQQNDLRDILTYLGYKQYLSPRNEADDVIAKLISETKPTIIFTSDKDIMQLVDQDCQIYNGRTIFDETEVKKKFLVPPKYIADLLAIMGDTSDNIQGVKNYGPKKSANAIKEFGLVEKIPHKHPLDKYKQKILNNKRLTQLNKNCELKECIPNKNTTLHSILNKYELKKIGDKINKYKETKQIGTIDKWI